MASIGPQRVRLIMDTPTLRVHALEQAILSTGGYVSTSNDPDDWYTDLVKRRAEAFLSWLQTPDTFGGEDDTPQPES